jgi:nifR3 family TIM-barrel protein
MNFGCPVRKVTRKGGGAALPLRPALLASIVRAAVGAAERVPVTIKFRIGIDDLTTTYPDAGRVAEEEGCAAVGLHARTASALYSGSAEWDTITDLKRRIKIPVLGNGDIWEAADALRMMRQTGCDGVIVGRGCLGRPWLFRDLADVFEGRDPINPPRLGEVLDVMCEHARRLAGWFGEAPALVSFRRHVTWYTKGFTLAPEVRRRMTLISTLDELRSTFEGVDRSQPFPPESMRVKRGKKGGAQTVALPPGYREGREDVTYPEADDEVLVSGG